MIASPDKLVRQYSSFTSALEVEASKELVNSFNMTMDVVGTAGIFSGGGIETLSLWLG
jgi:hypothetical protein